jgi:hypothetical protein
MCFTLAPSHLLFLHHPFAHDLIDRRLDETGSDLFPVAITFTVIRYELLVALDMGLLSQPLAAKTWSNGRDVAIRRNSQL